MQGCGLSAECSVLPQNPHNLRFDQQCENGGESSRDPSSIFITMILHNGQATCVIFLSLMQEAVEGGGMMLLYAGCERPCMHTALTKAIVKTAMFGILHQGIFQGMKTKSIKIGLLPVPNLRVRTY